MSATITCRGCGTILGIPKSGMPAEGLPCVWCGEVTKDEPRPAPLPVAKQLPEPAARTATATNRVPEPPAKPAAPLHRWADDDEDDGQPYALPPDEVKTKRCVACHLEIEAKAFVCVHCGHDERTKKKAQRTYEAIDREWEAGWSFERRLTIFLACQVMNVTTIVIGSIAGQPLGVSLTGAAFYVFLQAFLLGTYDRLRVRRNKKGQVEIVQTWRFCFVPAAPKKIDWKAHEGVAVGVYNGSGFIDWWMCLVLLPFFIVPAILWWWFVIRSDRHFMALTRDQGFPDIYLYRGLNEKQAREIAQVVSDVTGLRPTTSLAS